MQKKYDYRTIVISDVHLGTTGSKAIEATNFIKEFSCERLILNGDIIDGWQLKKYGAWKKKHTAFIRAVLKTIEQKDTEVYYIRGNHDDFLDQFIPFTVGPNFKIVKEMVLNSGSNKFYITHGDVFDLVTTKAKWLAHIGDMGYIFLLWLNKKYNHYRILKGKPYYSLSQKVKNSIKMAVNYVSDFEQQLSEMAKSKECSGIICGHIHQPAIKEINGIAYMNSGDWVENKSALVEDFNGNWEIVYDAYHLNTISDNNDNANFPIEFDMEEIDSEFAESYAHIFELK
ncbi:MAG: UDP-2,3-diacylglucosamine pyrophosphatase LpxH [Arcticibacterium sp.]|jgi:UDP-2,3-diacylglucosamine pyrophosphatase LpxH